MFRIPFILVAVAGFGIAGCSYGLADPSDYESAGSPLTIQEPMLAGAAGDVAVDETAEVRVHSAELVDNTAYIELRGYGSSGVLMQNYIVSNFDRFAPGDRVIVAYSATDDDLMGEEPDDESEGDDSWTDDMDVEEPPAEDDSADDVFVIGCSGPTDDEWNFDEPAEEVTMEVEEGPEPETLKLTFTSRFPSYFGGEGEIVRGSVVVRMN